ncbi:MAG: hypothetical protein E6K19_00395, partial [Methanobacteriota archaeon]
MIARVPVLLAILTAGLFSLAPAAAQTPIYATMSGPSAIAPGRTASYELTATGGPGDPVNYSVSWYVTGPN